MLNLPARPRAVSALRALPSVRALADHPAWRGIAVSPPTRTAVCREAIASVRASVREGVVAPTAVAGAIDAALASRIRAIAAPTVAPLLNGAGVLLHTNVGRAPLPPEAIAAISEAARGYNTLEIDRSTGGRGTRQDHCRPLLRWLTGAADALVVNNGAAAALIALRAVARGRPVVVSRGELVEIGGGFRVPEVLEAAACALVEVGATNRTHLEDYAAALERLHREGRPAAALLRVHRSNFAVVGFASQPALRDLGALARQWGACLVVDVGSGALAPLPVPTAALPDGSAGEIEPTVADIVAAGADLVTFSGDKLVGGPQAGIVVGAREPVALAARDPLVRALRPGSLTIAGLAAVLAMHAQGRAGELPALAAAALPEGAVENAAVALAARLARALPEVSVAVGHGTTLIGGGTHPLYVVPSRELVLLWPGCDGATLAARALRGDPPLLARARGPALHIDVRSLIAGRGDRDDAGLAAAIARALATG